GGIVSVTHMTVVGVSGLNARPYLQYLLANDVDRIAHTSGKALYTAMLNHQGGVVDDLIVHNRSESYRVVLNCATRDHDLEWMATLNEDYQVELKERDDLAMIAVQGPEAIDRVKDLLPKWAAAIADLTPFQAVELGEWFIGRTGYT